MFEMYGLAHFIYIFLAIGISVALIFALKRFEGSVRKYISIAITAIATLFVLLQFLGRVLNKVKIGDNLPLNMLDIFVYLMIFIEFSKKISWVKFGYFIMVPLSILSLFVMPNYYLSCGATSVSTISYFVIISLIVSYCVLKLIWCEEYLYKKDVLDSAIYYGVIVASAHIINVLFRFTTLGVHADYFGTMAEEYNPVYAWISKLIPLPFVNMLPIIAIVVGIEFLMILPFDIIRARRDRQSQFEEIVALGNMKAQQAKRRSGKSHILVRSDVKAAPQVAKTVTNSQKEGFVKVNKEINVNKDE